MFLLGGKYWVIFDTGISDIQELILWACSISAK